MVFNDLNFTVQCNGQHYNEHTVKLGYRRIDNGDQWKDTERLIIDCLDDAGWRVVKGYAYCPECSGLKEMI